jgi:1,4-dihydroxy-2-naphthoate octaprenyltransferase
MVPSDFAGRFGELVVWGHLMIEGSYYTITGEWSWEVVLAELPYALLGTTALVFGKHIDKFGADKVKASAPSRY